MANSIIGGLGGNKVFSSSEVSKNLWELIDEAGVDAKKSFYRGDNLGSVITTEQLNAIKDGSFTGLFIGDYWTVDGYIYRIADFNYWMNVGDKNTDQFKKNHIVVVQDLAYLDKSTLAQVGYVNYMNANSYIQTTGPHVSRLNTMFKSKNYIFHPRVIDVSTSYVNSTNKRLESSYTNSKFNLLSQSMLFGSKIIEGNYPYKESDKMQLSIFRLRPDLIWFPSGSTGTYWLRDTAVYDPVSSSGTVAWNQVSITNREVNSNALSTTLNKGIRLVFGVCGQYV